MLNSLEINNIALIDKLSIEIEDGMTVLTGETGAGKSIIIDSVNLILGARAAKGLIRYGEEKARVQALFCVSDSVSEKLSELGIEVEDNEVAVVRDITSDSKSVCRINGMIVTLSTLKDAAALLVNIHGQQDNQSLLNQSYHLSYLDSFAANDEIKEKYQSCYDKHREIENKIEKLTGNEKERLERVDLLKYQTDEIIEAALSVGEKEELINKINLAENAQMLSQGAGDACELLYDGEEQNAYDLVSRTIGAMSKISDIDEVSKILDKIYDLRYAIEDIVEEVRALTDGIDFSGKQLEDMQDRLDVIRKMEKKYGGSVEAVLEYLDKASEELCELDAGEERFDGLKNELDLAEKAREKAAKELTKSREKAAKELSIAIEESLKELDMPKVRFNVAVTEDKFSRTGRDNVEFLICPNVGEELKPLAKFASGGELSRVMLAMKSILADADDADTLIFDEIDTGVSGSAAQKIAKKLKKLSCNKQVICVSHQPQLAVSANQHLLIKKLQKGERTATTLTKLDTEGRILEVARITDGENPGEAALNHAKEMLENA